LFASSISLTWFIIFSMTEKRLFAAAIGLALAGPSMAEDRVPEPPPVDSAQLDSATDTGEVPQPATDAAQPDSAIDVAEVPQLVVEYQLPAEVIECELMLSSLTEVQTRHCLDVVQPSLDTARTRLTDARRAMIPYWSQQRDVEVPRDTFDELNAAGHAYTRLSALQTDLKSHLIDLAERSGAQ
jgi:hypothetical protein